MSFSEENSLAAPPLDKEELGRRLRARGQALGLSGAEVARQAGLEARRYNTYLNGKREISIFVLVKVTVVLQISVGDLLATGEGELRSALARVGGEPSHSSAADTARDEATNHGPSGTEECGSPPATPYEVDLARVYELLAPAIIRRYVPGELEIGLLPRDKYEAGVLMRLTCDCQSPPEEFQQQLKALTKELLNLGDEQITIEERRRYDGETIWITMTIRYGRRRRRLG